MFLVGLGPKSSTPGTNIVFDPIDLLTGDEAIKEAVKRGTAATGPDGQPFVANDVLIVNDDTSTVTMRVTPDALVTLNLDASGPKPALIDEAIKVGKTGDVPVSLPFKITIQGTGQDARIVKVEYIFTP